jgi:hypothetical protein
MIQGHISDEDVAAVRDERYTLPHPRVQRKKA